MGRPWSTVYRSLHATGGQRTCWELGFPSRCRVNRLTVTQVSAGPRSDFTLKVFNSRRPCTGASGSSGGVDDPAGYYEAVPDSYLVFSPLRGSAGDLEEFYRETGYVYENQDGGGPSTREYRVYLEINPDSGGEFVYDVSFTCELPYN